MYNYKEANESHDGSHFFIKTSEEAIIRVSLMKPNEDYVSDYLETNVRHLIVYNMTNTKLRRTSAVKICETIEHIVYDFLAYKNFIVKIEVNNRCGKNIQILKYLDNRPNDIKGFTKENLDNCILYFLYNKNKIEGTDLLYNLIEEYKE